MRKQDKNVYTKSRLIKELAFRSGIKQSASKLLLEALVEIAYREARLGPFIIPGICKLELCDRKSRKLRNPRTGEQLIMPPHKALRITASRRAKDAIAPRVTAVPASTYVAPEPVIAPEAATVLNPAATPSAVSPVTAVPPAPVSEVVRPVEEPVVAPVVTPVVEPSASAPVLEPEVKPETVPLSASAEPVKPIEVKPPTGEVPPPAAVPESAEPEVAEETAPESAESSASVAEPIPTPAVDTAAETEPVSPPAAESAPSADNDEPISFRCPGCSQEIEAPHECVGMEAECPMCGRIVIVPPVSEPGTMYGDAAPGETAKPTPEVVTAKEAEDMDPAQLENRTIRIDASLLGFDDDPPAQQSTGEQMISFFCKKCHQEIEATADMAGSTAECPNCGEPFVVPMFSDAGTVYDDSKEKADAQKSIEVQKHSTMRIDLPDDF